MDHLVLPTSNNYYQERIKTIVELPSQLHGLQTESIRALNREHSYNNLLFFLFIYQFPF